MDLEKIFDLILQVALKEDLKPEQMIKKLFVFTYCIPSRLYDSCAWETKYEAIQRMFKDIGYEDDVVPHILFWDIANWNSPSIDLPCPRLTLLRGWSNNLVKSFLDNGGNFRPHHHLMEAAIADKEYQTLAVVN
ncbi:PREDICTED: LOW QUALITY PROTEIN [Prunus dulcis]|uniref:PREDICTED: LOW QUALITY PROTEIN n=1 Tax=Prunus dulcis TaxID=3755 RepID=A0A5E4FXS9_PRUDU|nr:PREDICTED: LOW QUALITY PROTEIN [Prunus dulcis]